MAHLPADFDMRVAEGVAEAMTVPGHLTEREARFLYLLGAMPCAEGGVLEIGTYRGRSAVLLAKAAREAGEASIAAVDPLDSPAATDPPAAAEARQNLQATFDRHGIGDAIDFFHERSESLAVRWNRPLRLLWIDGDHSLAGARRDLAAFRKHLAPGAIVAMHDVLHAFEGPLRVFTEDLLGDPACGTCGVCGSIGWAQIDVPHVNPQRDRLRRRLHKLLRFVQKDRPPRGLAKIRYQLARAGIPHGKVDPHRWVRTVRYRRGTPAP